jgi:hypothetical protein
MRITNKKYNDYELYVMVEEEEKLCQKGRPQKEVKKEI